MFLATFHAERPGETSSAFASLPVVSQGKEYPSSYAVLASALRAPAARARVLDLACGDGYLLSMLSGLAGAHVQLHGADLSMAELQRAHGRLGASATLCRSRAQSLPFEDGTFDHVFCHLALMLMDDVDRVMAELHRVMKPDAVLAAVVGGRSPPSPGQDVFRNVISRYSRQEQFTDVRIGDARFRTREGIGELLAPLFTDVCIDDISIGRRLAPAQLWQWFLGMYDLYLLDDAARVAVQPEFLAAAAAACEEDGRIPYQQAMLFFSARNKPGTP